MHAAATRQIVGAAGDDRKHWSGDRRRRDAGATDASRGRRGVRAPSGAPDASAYFAALALAGSREQAIDRMVAIADARGAKAIVSVRSSTLYVMGNASEILVYGDAVVLETD